MKQLSMGTGFEEYARATRRERFLGEMERIYCLQLWFNLSNPEAEDALYDPLAMRRFSGIDLGEEPVPDKDTVCRLL